MKKSNHGKALSFLTAVGALSATLVPAAHASDEIHRPWENVRSEGMGNVRITTGLWDQNFFGNPARVTANPNWRIQLPDLTFEITASAIGSISDLTSSSNPIKDAADRSGKNTHGRFELAFPGFYWPNVGGGKWSYAFAVLTSVSGEANVHNNFTASPKVTADISPAFTVGRKLLDDDALSVGATAHANYRAEGNYSFFDFIAGRGFSLKDLGAQGGQYDVDVGGTYVLPLKPMDIELSVAGTVNNVLGGKYTNLKIRPFDSTGQASATPRSVGVGFKAYKESTGIFHDSMVALEFTDIGNNASGSLFRTVHLGGETSFKIFSFRGGINQGYLAAGAGINLKYFNLDVATYGEETSLNVGGSEDRRVALHLGFQI